jgi:hypothetical protein
MFKIVGGDGKEWGLVSAEQLTQWITEGRVHDQTRAQREGTTEWKPLSEFPEWQTTFAPAANLAARKSANPTPQRVLPAGAPARKSGMPGWVIALIVCGCLAFLLFFVVILAAMLLPALAKAKARAQTITCTSHLKGVSMAFVQWASEHNGQYPFNISTSNGGSYELCDRGPDGLDRNSWMHFRAMSKELVNPKMLVCPSDNSKQAVAEFSDLRESNVSYKIVSGMNVSGAYPEMVLVFCPLHHNFALADGSVHHTSEEEMNEAVKATVERVRAGTR